MLKGKSFRDLQKAEQDLEKRSKNVRERIGQVYGGWKTKPDSEQRAKQMESLGRLSGKRYGLKVERAPGKPNVHGVIIDKPNLANPKGKVQHIGNPDSLTHELAHIELAPEGKGLKQLQSDMDKEWGRANVQYGYQQHARTKQEYETKALENPIRRRAGLPAHQKFTPDKSRERTLAADQPGRKITLDVPTQHGTKRLTGTSQNVSPEAKERMSRIDSGELVYDKRKGWREGQSIHAKINRRARSLKSDPDFRPTETYGMSFGKRKILERSGQ